MTNSNTWAGDPSTQDRSSTEPEIPSPQPAHTPGPWVAEGGPSEDLRELAQRAGVDMTRQDLRDAVWVGYTAALAAQPAPVAPEVWEAGSKTATMLFHTQAEAKAWASQFAPSIAGGFTVHARTVYHYPAAPQTKEPTNDR